MYRKGSLRVFIKPIKMYRKGALYFIGKTVKNIESVGKEKQ